MFGFLIIFNFTKKFYLKFNKKGIMNFYFKGIYLIKVFDDYFHFLLTLNLFSKLLNLNLLIPL